jgi:hypothetical protein
MRDYPNASEATSFDVASLLEKTRQSSGVWFNWRGIKTADVVITTEAVRESDRMLVVTRGVGSDGASWEYPWVFAMVPGSHEFTVSSSAMEGEWIGHEGGQALRIRAVVPMVWWGWTVHAMADHWAFRLTDRMVLHEIRFSKWSVPLGRVSMVTLL